MTNDRKWIYLSYIVAAFIVAWVLNQALLLSVSALRLSNPSLLGTISASALASGLIVGIFSLWFVRRPKVDAFTGEVMQEMHKVTWPARKNTVMSTGIVVVVVMIGAFILAVYDWLCSNLIHYLLKV